MTKDNIILGIILILLALPFAYITYWIFFTEVTTIHNILSGNYNPISFGEKLFPAIIFPLLSLTSLIIGILFLSKGLKK